MAITLTDRGVATTGTGGVSATNTVTSASFTPAAGSTIAVAVSLINNDGGAGANTISVSTTLTMSSAFTRSSAAVLLGTGSYSLRVEIWTGVYSSGTGTITVTRTAGTIDQWLVGAFVELSGVSGLGAFGTVSSLASSTTATITMGSAPASASLVLGCVSDNNGATSATEPTGWTELHDNAGTGIGDTTESAYINGSGSQTFNWSGLSADVFGYAAVALEFTAASSFVAPEPLIVPQSIKRGFW